VLPVPLTAFLDANVIYSRCLRDWLILIALDSHYTAFRPRWSEAVLAEAFYHLRRKHPAAPERAIERWREQLDQHFPESKVTHWNPESVPPPADPNDHHVLAAAHAGHADILVTAEIAAVPDFQACLDKIDSGVTVLHVDDFLCMISDRYPSVVRRRYLSQIKYQRGRDGVDEETAADACKDALDRAGATRFAFRLGTDARFRIW
jgi:predicted nucleic acid-binding protein